MYASPSDNYWLVGDQPDDQRWSSARVIYVADSDATYVSWIAAGYETSEIDTEQALADLLNATYPAGSPIPIAPVYPTPGGNGPIYHDIIKSPSTVFQLAGLDAEAKSALPDGSLVPRIAPYNRKSVDVGETGGVVPFAAVSGNIVVPAGVYRLVLTGQAAGGAGGGVSTTAGPGSGSGGGPGETRRVIVDVVPGQTIAYSIGAEGAGSNGAPGQTAGDLLIGSGTPPFPVVAATASTSDMAANTGGNINLPAGIVAGNLLLATIVATHSSAFPTITTPAGWNVIAGTTFGNASRSLIMWKTATGSEGATLALTTSNATLRAAVVQRITGHDPGGASAILVAGISEQGTPSKYPNPPALNVTWGIKSTLWIASAQMAANIGIGGLPSGFTDPQNANGQGVATATLNSNNTTVNPSAFTAGGSYQWNAHTVAILPATPAAIMLCKGGLGGNYTPGGGNGAPVGAPPAGTGGIRIEPTALGDNFNQTPAFSFGGSTIFGQSRINLCAGGSLPGKQGGGFGSGGAGACHGSAANNPGGAGGPGMILIEGYGLDAGST